jgi:hypothetical protein
MISKSKLGAIAFIAAMGLAPLASPAVAQFNSPQYSPSVTGGGSSGYNRGLRYYRLGKHHHAKKLHAQVKPQASAKPQAPKTSGGNPGGGQGAGGAAAKQPMGRP